MKNYCDCETPAPGRFRTHRCTHCGRTIHDRRKQRRNWPLIALAYWLGSQQ